ncbi:NAD-dependent epimerase/dehydratase family protein [Fulvimarina endophytica]|uniref:NAD-dependent epimerase/dehydratase family protein n=1 Tax=Fulvimarina endophytica TaxID=2293836 RepID=A0A371X5T6_9HYPH|nr:D-erythronate dehydrogenase [Fulvimarina endophytica]RFC64580.1 NAD-dependent epimerase/dehydratase family protein [Fulvimarina endophytica]
MHDEGATIVVTGAGGFIGAMVVEDLASRGTVTIGGRDRTIGRIVALDIAEGPLDDLARRQAKVESIAGDLADEGIREAILASKPDAIIHLAAVVSSAAEADFDLGLAVNVRSLMDLLSAVQRLDQAPVFVFASSVAVFSAQGNADIDEDLEPRPLSSYGTQKVIGELLVRDAARRGIIDGRTIRFPTISIRPGAPNKAASSFASGIVREPLKGETSILPVSRDTRLHLASPSNAVAAVIRTLSLERSEIGQETTITLPGLSVTVAEMLDTLERVAGPETAGLVTDQEDAAISTIVSTWPGRVAAPRAERLGFTAETSFEEIVREHMERSKPDPTGGRS